MKWCTSSGPVTGAKMKRHSDGEVSSSTKRCPKSLNDGARARARACNCDVKLVLHNCGSQSLRQAKDGGKWSCPLFPKESERKSPWRSISHRSFNCKILNRLCDLFTFERSALVPLISRTFECLSASSATEVCNPVWTTIIGFHGSGGQSKCGRCVRGEKRGLT